MKEIAFSIFFISVGFFLSSYWDIKMPFLKDFKINSSVKESQVADTLTYLLQLKIKKILNQNNVKYSDVKINSRSIFLNTLISNKDLSFSVKQDTGNFIEVEVLENIESDKIVNFIFQISVFERNNNQNKTHEIVENVSIKYFFDKSRVKL